MTFNLKFFYLYINTTIYSKPTHMKLLQLSFFLGLIMILSCQKELSGDNSLPPSSGSLKSNITGDCLPVSINGIFMAGTDLATINYMDVQIDVAVAGSYTIASDTINGFSFKGEGSVIATGINTVRLTGSGRPVTAGINTFTIKYGTSICSVNIIVVAAGTGAAIYTLNTTGTTCAGAVLNGIYKAGTLLDISNSVKLTVNVATAGTYSVNIPAANGISFLGIGIFTSTGPQTLTLNASGTPLSAGNTNMTATAGTGSCTFSITVQPATGSTIAMYTLGGAGSACTGVTLSGNYISGTVMTAANIAKLDVNVTNPGTYTLSTTAINGVTFSASGTFASTGAQQVTLTASGTPAAAGIQNYPVTGGGNTCTFPVTFNAPAPPAVYTLSGEPSACTTPVINGAYVATVPLNATNTIVIKVDVITPGAYTLTTNTVNGMTFSGSGIFASAGTGINVTLTGSGIPATAGTTTLTPIAGTSSYTFDVVTGAAPTGTYTCKIDGVFFSFYDRAKAQVDNMGSPYLFLDGFNGPPTGNTVPEFQMFITKNNSTAVGPGSYNVDGLILPNGYRIEIDYKVLNPDNSTTIWNTSSSFLSPNPPFTIVVSTATSTRVTGTFSGKITNTLQGSTIQKNVTEGVFDLPIQ